MACARSSCSTPARGVVDCSPAMAHGRSVGTVCWIFVIPARGYGIVRAGGMRAGEERGQGMDREDTLRNLFTRTRPVRTRMEAEADIEAEMIREMPQEEPGGTTAPEPLLAPEGVEREQWRGYVLICL